MPPPARQGAVAAASKCSSRGSGASAKPQKRARPDFQLGETSEHRQFLTITDQRVTDEAAAAVGALAATCVTHPAVAPGTRGWKGLLARSALPSARPRLLCAPTCAGPIFPLLAPGPVPRGGCGTSTAPVESSWWLRRLPSAAQLHNRKAREGSRMKDAFGLIFGCLKEHRHHPSLPSSPTALCLVHPWALRIGSDITQLNRDLALGVRAALIPSMLHICTAHLCTYMYTGTHVHRHTHI